MVAISHRYHFVYKFTRRIMSYYKCCSSTRSTQIDVDVKLALVPEDFPRIFTLRRREQTTLWFTHLQYVHWDSAAGLVTSQRREI